MIIVTRNTHDYGPYDEYVVAHYVEEGKLLMRDKARDAATGEQGTIQDFLERADIHPKIKHSGSLAQQLHHIGSEFIIPSEGISQRGWLEDKRLMILALVGLFLSVLFLFPIGGYLVFYAVSLYFATIWGLFFYYFFKTRQVRLKTTLYTFFLTQIGIFLIFTWIYKFNIFYFFTDAAFPFNMIGFICGVGLSEEFIKMIPLLLLVRNAKEPLLPQTLVFYGLMSGIAFGVFEGVQYQTTVNIHADYTTAFLLNISRLTSLPFLHAVWCGICGYFVAYANLYPRYRKSLYVLSLAIPATLHGLYDTFAGSLYIVSLLVAFASVILLMTYLRKGTLFQQRLKL